MDILNRLPVDQYNAVDDLLTFISIYDDTRRTRAYLQMLEAERDRIQGAVCVDAGAGIGLFSERMIQLGAKTVYAVEPNPYLFQLARKRLEKYPNVKFIQAPVETFEPEEPVDILVHEFFGQLLYDEDLYDLEKISFKPRLYLPDKATLMYGTTQSSIVADDTVTLEVLRMLEGVLVSGLFDEGDLPLQHPVISWEPDYFPRSATVEIVTPGDVLYLGLKIWHQNREMCVAGLCSNWAYVWTPVAGTRFSLQFLEDERGSEVVFQWI